MVPEVGGSNPLSHPIFSIIETHGPIAQLAEHRTLNPQVPGSIPGWPTIKNRRFAYIISIRPVLETSSGAGLIPILIPTQLRIGRTRRPLRRWLVESRALDKVWQPISGQSTHE